MKIWNSNLHLRLKLKIILLIPKKRFSIQAILEKNPTCQNSVKFKQKFDQKTQIWVKSGKISRGKRIVCSTYVFFKKALLVFSG